MIIIGEKLNRSVPAVGEAIARRDGMFIRDLAYRQVQAGAAYLDICASGVEREAEILQWMIEEVQEVTDVPLVIDSPDAELLPRMTSFCRRPGLLNSVSLESRTQIDKVLEQMSELPGWGVVAMLCDDKGIPGTAAERLVILERIMEKIEAYGIETDRIYIDPIVEAAAFVEPEREEGPGALTSLKTIQEIRKRYPKVHMIASISNISYGLPARSALNCSFAALALAAGLNCAILDPLAPGMLAALYGTETLLGLDEDGMCMEYVSAYRAGLFEKK